MNLMELLKPEACVTNFQAASKDQALMNLAEMMVKNNGLGKISAETVYTALKEREDKGSTGFGRGIAIPHCQVNEIDKFYLGIAASSRGVSFDALDKKKVKLFVVIVGPASDRTGHLKLLAKISHILKEPDTYENLIASTTKIGLYEEFLRHTSGDELKVQKKKKDKLMIITVKNEEIMQDLTEVFIQYGITESTIIETQQMENLMSTVPLFMGFFNFTSGRNPFSKLILVKTNSDQTRTIIKGMEEIFGDLDNYTDLSVMVLNLFYSKGF